MAPSQLQFGTLAVVVWVRVILLFFAIGSNLLQLAKNKSHVFANLAARIHSPKVRNVSSAKDNKREIPQ